MLTEKLFLLPGMPQWRELYSTQDTFNGSISESWLKENTLYEARNLKDQLYEYPALNSPVLSGSRLKHQRNISKDIIWSSDGSSLVSVNEDFGIRLYMMLTDVPEHQCMVPMQRVFSRNAAMSYCLHPRFDLLGEESFEYGWNSILISERQLPMKLVSLVPTAENKVLNYYHFRDTQNEKFHDVYSMDFVNELAFVVGGRNRLGVFTLERSDPISELDLNEINAFGIASAIKPFREQNHCIYVGSYLNQIAGIDLSSEEYIFKKTLDGFDGIYQLLESENKNYLYVLGRKSTQIPILDRRMDHKQVGVLTGWQSSYPTNQKCYGDLLPQNQGLIVGNQQGMIKIWEDCALGLTEEGKTFLDTNKCAAIPSVKCNPNDANTIAYSQGCREVLDVCQVCVTRKLNDNKIR